MMSEWHGCVWCPLRQLPGFRNPQSLAVFFFFLRSVRQQSHCRAELWLIGVTVFVTRSRRPGHASQRVSEAKVKRSPQGSINTIEWCWHSSAPPIEFMTDTEGPRRAVIAWHVLNTVLLVQGFELIYNRFWEGFSWLASSLSEWGLKCAKQDVVTIFEDVPSWLFSYLSYDRPVKFKNFTWRGQGELARIS